MIDPKQIQQLRDILGQWAKTVASDLGADGIYLFGSLVYRNGTQFVKESDIDLAIQIPDVVEGAIGRTAWIGKLFDHKLKLEKDLLAPFSRENAGEPICSVVAITESEARADIHKDGAEEFFKSNPFLNLLDNNEIDGFPNAGEAPIRDRLVRQCFRFAQKKRNAFLGVSANGSPGLQEFDGADPIPKDVMRHAAMAARLRNPGAPRGAEYDTQAGLDFLTSYLYDVRDRDAAYGRIHHWVSVRRGARGNVEQLEAIDWVFFSEIVWDLASDALQAHLAQRAEEQATEEAGVPGGRSTVFFADRFAQAFPGVRGISWFDESDHVRKRLTTLLASPLSFSGRAPIWWWRDGNGHIQHFQCIRVDEYLMDYTELKIRKVAAVNPGIYSRLFVYVEAIGMTPTGLYKRSDESTAAVKSCLGYDVEEYGLLVDGRCVTRAEYDDGAAHIDNQLLDIRERAKLRVRYLSPYNFVIAAQGSPINNTGFDPRLKKYMNRMLQGEDMLAAMLKDVIQLPLRDN